MKIKLNNGKEFETRTAYNCPAYGYIAIIGVSPSAKEMFAGHRESWNGKVKGRLQFDEDRNEYSGCIYPEEIKEIVLTAKELR